MTHHGSVTDSTNLHRAHAWEYANSAARTAATGFVAADVGKLARQLDTNFLYMLIDDSPVTWQTVATGGIPAAHTHSSSDITDFAEAVDDRVGALVVDSSSIDVTYNDAGNAESIAVIDEYIRDLVGTLLAAGTGVTVTVDDPGNTITIATSGGYTDEQARDAIGAALTAGTGIAITVNDAGDTIGIAATGGVAPAAHTHTGSEVTDFAETADDRIASLIVAGAGISATYNDAAGTLTLASTVSAGAVLTPIWLTGRYYGLQEAGVPSFPGGAGITANRLYLVPLLVPTARTVDRIGIQVTAAVASSNVRLGIYGPFNAAGTATLLLDAGTIDSSTTGSKELTISQAIPAGIAYLGVISNGAANVLAASGWGFSNLHGQTGLSGTDKAYGFIKDGTGGYAGLPGTFTVSGASTFSSGPIPMVRAT